MIEVSRFFETASHFVLAALPAVAFAGIFALSLGRRHRDQEKRDWRETFLLSAVIWAALTFAITELLSLGTALNSLSLALFWGFVILVLLFLLKRNLSQYSPGNCLPAANELPFIQKFLLFWVALSLAVTALIAVVAPPNNWDSMVYHMSRVAHWWANGTVAFYPTNIQRQLYSSPLAEYMILQFFALSGGSDRLVNLVQWFCLGGCAIAMSLIARRLGANGLTQWLVAFVVVTTPTPILESTSTQNDLVCAFLTACTLYFLYCDRTILTGLCLGLAVLVKSPSGLAVLPFLILLFTCEAFHQRRTLKVAGKLAVIGCIALAINTPLWLRNTQTFQNPLGYQADVKTIASQTAAFGPFVTNVIRDLASELETPSLRISEIEEEGIRKVCKVLRLNIDDPRNSFLGEPFALGKMVADEDVAANPLQIALLIVATIFLLTSRRLRSSQAAKFAICVWAGFLLVAWRLSWQAYLSRILTPFLVLSSIPIAVFLSELRGRHRFVAGTLVTVLAVASLFPLLHNWTRPFVSIRQSKSVFAESRQDLYFMKRSAWQSCYEKTIEILSSGSCQKVGIKFSWDGWEYPLWALAKEKGDPLYFEHIDVENQTRSTKAGYQGATCATVTFHDAETNGPTLTQPAWIELHTPGAAGAETADRIECKP